MNKKQKVWLWSESIQITKMTDENRAGYNQNGNPTPLENLVNVLSVMPSDGIERMIETIVQSVKYSQELGETEKQLKERINTDIFKNSTYAKNL